MCAFGDHLIVTDLQGIIIYRAGPSRGMRYAAFTVDVDRDVNQAVQGRIEAASRERDGDRTPRYASSARGLSILADLLDELDIRATFFMEGMTAVQLSSVMDLKEVLRRHEVAFHGLAHEDLTGESTGVLLGIDVISDMVDKGLSMVKEATGQMPIGFRAPYQHVNEEILDILPRKGMLYDSSITQDIIDRKIVPYDHPSGLVEFPIARGRDKSQKKIVSYLWPMHEGKRVPSDYIDLIDGYDDGALVIATHTWHIVERFSGPLVDDEIRSSIDDVRAVLSAVIDRDIRIMTLNELLYHRQ